ncbi:hypothetical protein Goshw_030191 [Gossypium schwendimanii]|uniref:Uncharacterized protein n=1 Tax=Gossypium schwendimanii TaxID=34291 RepID=A0A7J9N4I3_GOSSC|nr:hypothetical protein [Gossypium schwendimanii]
MAGPIYYRQRRGRGNYMSKGKMWPFKSKTQGRRRRPINEAQTFTQSIIMDHRCIC